MDEIELKNIRKYLHTIQQSCPKSCGSYDSCQLNKLVAVTDSRLFEELITKTYQYKEYTFRKKRIKRRQLSAEVLANIRCSEEELNERIGTVQLPYGPRLHKIEISDPGDAFFEFMQLRRTSRRRMQSLNNEMGQMKLNWKTVGLCFGQISVDDDTNEGLFIDKIEPKNSGTAGLMRGDQILAVDGIVFDKQTLDTLNTNVEQKNIINRSVSVAVTTFYEIMTSILDAWVKNEWLNQPSGQRRSVLHLIVARWISSTESLTSVSESNFTSNPTEPDLGDPNEDLKQQPDERKMEVGVIDFHKTDSGIGAFLTPGPGDLGACVERLVDGKLAQQDGRLHVGDNLLYINEKPVMNRTFKDVLRIYRYISIKAEAASPHPTLGPIRLIVSRSINECDNGLSHASTTHFSTVPQNSVLLAAAKLASDIQEKCQSLSATSSTTSPTTVQLIDDAFTVGPFGVPLSFLKPPDLIFMPTDYDDIVGLNGQSKQNVVIEEVVSDNHLENVDKWNSPVSLQTDLEVKVALANASGTSGSYWAYPAQSNVAEQGRDAVQHSPNTHGDITNKIITGKYTLPSKDTPLGISVETLVKIDPANQKMNFRHRLVEVNEGGVIATQTELKPMDEIQEINGVVVIEKDSLILLDVLANPQISGYLVCRRPVTSIDQTSMDVGGGIISIPSESCVKVNETKSKPDNMISNLRRKFEDHPQELDSIFPNKLPKERERGSRGEEKIPLTPQGFCAEMTDTLSDSANALFEIIINKNKGEMLGVTLDHRNDSNGDYVVAYIEPNGALDRTQRFKAAHHGVRVDVGDVVMAINGKSLHEISPFSVHSLLWGMLTLEGNVSFKFKPMGQTKSEPKLPTEVPQDNLVIETSSFSTCTPSMRKDSKLSYYGPLVFGISTPSAEVPNTNDAVSSAEPTLVSTTPPAMRPNQDSVLTQSSDRMPSRGYIKLMVEQYMQSTRNA